MEQKEEDVRRKFGNYGVFCNGAILVHPIRPWWCLLEIYTVVVQIIFLTEYYRFNMWLVLAEVILGLLAILFTFKTTLTDPGICPKPSPEVARENEAEVYRQRRQGCVNARKMLPNPKYHPIKAPTAPRLVDCSYCARCQIFRYPNTSHCYTCDCCVTHLDHHCPVFGGCVAQGNICWFYGMITFMPLYWIYVLIVTSGSMFVQSEYSPEVAKSIYDGASYTFYFVIVGFVGALVCPAFLSQFSCLDKVHSQRRRPQRPAARFPEPRTLTNVSYPRQPMLPIVKPKTEDVNSNEPIAKIEDNGNGNQITQVEIPDTDTDNGTSDELAEEIV